MSRQTQNIERIRFLVRVVEGECRNLKATDARLFSEPFTEHVARQLDSDPVLSERVDAFVARFSRLQDTLGDKLLPLLLAALGEDRPTLIDRLDKAERLGWLQSAERWMAIRQLRNQMIHEYIEEPAVFAPALQTGHEHVGQLLSTAENMLNEIAQRKWLAT